MSGFGDKISIPKLKGTDNYTIWSLRTKAILTEKSYIDNLTEIDQSDNKALALLTLLYENGPLLQIRNENTTKEIWLKLESLYNPKRFTTNFLIASEFFNTTLQKFINIEKYFHKIKELSDNFKSKEIIIPEQIIISWVLNSLDNLYESFISNVSQALKNDPKAYNTGSLFAHLIDESKGKNNNRILFTNRRCV